MNEVIKIEKQKKLFDYGFKPLFTEGDTIKMMHTFDFRDEPSIYTEHQEALQ